MEALDFEKTVITEILGAVTVFSEKGRTDKMEIRKSYGISLCYGGRITYVEDGEEYVSEEGCAVIFPKGKTYLIRREKTGHFPVINFECKEPLCDKITVIKTENADRLLTLYKKIEALFGYPQNKMRIFSLLYEMLHTLSADNIPFVLKKSLRIINEEYQNPALTNDMLARECKVSTVHFRKIFTKHLGISPRQFIIDFRIQKAKQMLTENSLGIREIAERCGFANPYHFSRIFKEREGICAAAYRKKNQMQII